MSDNQPRPSFQAGGSAPGPSGPDYGTYQPAPGYGTYLPADAYLAPAPVAASVRKPASRARLALTIFAIVIIAAIIAIAISMRDADGPAQRSDVFLNNLEQGDYAAAYAMAAPELQNRLTQDGLEQAVTPLGLSTTCTTQWTQTVTNGDTQEASGTLTCPDATAPSYQVDLVWTQQADDTYKLTGLTIKP